MHGLRKRDVLKGHQTFVIPGGNAMDALHLVRVSEQGEMSRQVFSGSTAWPRNYYSPNKPKYGTICISRLASASSCPVIGGILDCVPIGARLKQIWMHSCVTVTRPVVTRHFTSLIHTLSSECSDARH